MKRPKRPSLGGPSLKAPNVKVPPFVADVYYDMRDRRLLPLVALVVVAIAAVPLLLGESEQPMPAQTPAESAAEAMRGETADASTLTVVEAKPGLRDYRKRLRDRSPTNPFRQRYVSLPPGAQLTTSETTSTSETGGGGGSTEVSVTEVEESVEEPSESPPSGSGGSGGTGGGGTDERPRLIEFVFDVQISHSEPTADGSTKMSEPEVRHKVRPLNALPSDKNQVATIMGVDLRNGKVMFMVADGARPVFGDFACMVRTDTCELLEIEPGMLLELELEANGVRYRFKVIKIDAVLAGRVGGGSSSADADLEGPYVRGAMFVP